MWSIFIPTMRNPFCSKVLTMSPVPPFSTASGLTIERVRCNVFILVLVVLLNLYAGFESADILVGFSVDKRPSNLDLSLDQLPQVGSPRGSLCKSQCKVESHVM